LFTETSPAQLSPADALAAFQYEPELRVELVAAEPLVMSPCAMAFDERGRLFVAENRGYPNAANPPQGDIVLLEDTDADGRMDKRTVFDGGLTFPNGVMPWRGGLIVTCAPDVLYLKDTDGDGKADERKVLLTGFATSGSTQLRVNAPTLGPDGWIYLAAGLSGGEITCPSHPERTALKMTADVRFHPDTLEVENVDGRSQYGMSFDDFGRRFICMNRVPVQHVVLSSKVLTRNPHLAFSETVQDCNERTVKTGLRGGGDGVRLFPISHNITTADSHAGSFSAACSIHIWRGGVLPERYRGCAFTCDPTGNLVHVDKLEPRGATFAAVPLLEGREFLASRDDWHRPVFLADGPDGALYICDMYRKTIEHPDYLPEEVRKWTDFESGKEMGRIWRVGSAVATRGAKHESFSDELAVISKALGDERELARLAGEANPRVRFGLAMALVDSDAPSAIDILAKLVAQDPRDRWLRAVVLSGIAGREQAFFRAVEPQLDATDLVPLLLDLQGGVDSSLIERTLNRAAQAVRDPSVTIERRAGFARLLGRGTWEKSSDSLRVVLSTSPDDSLRGVAISSLATIDAVRATPILLNGSAWQKYSPALRETVLSSLLSHSAALGGLLDAIESGVPSASALNTPQRNLFLKHQDPAIRKRAEKLFGAALTDDRQKAFEDAKAALSLAPNAEHGRELFKTHCATCHRLEREGMAVGPDLLDMRNQPKESILFHIVVPDAEVAPAFTGYLAETKDGRSLAGVLVAETAASVLLRMPGGTEETLLRGNLTKLEALPNSLMPAGLDAAMSRQDLADLLAFLKGEK
jgi:putative membrane-bound dehydrogenase-like protein